MQYLGNGRKEIGGWERRGGRREEVKIIFEINTLYYL